MSTQPASISDIGVINQMSLQAVDEFSLQLEILLF